VNRAVKTSEGERAQVYPEGKAKRIAPRWVVLAALTAGLVASTIACREEGGIEISDAWGPPSPSVATTGAFFMNITNTKVVDDALIGAVSPACGTVELHKSYMNAEGAMAMQPVAGGLIAVPAGGSAVLEQGGLHLMCINRLESFSEGATMQLTLHFEIAGDVELTIEIRAP
jgi:copper(I)-binding protein